MKFRLQFWSSATLGILAIRTIGNKFYFLRAIKSETDITQHNEENLQHCDYTEPMTQEEILSFIKKNSDQKIGRDYKNCIGLYLEDRKGEISSQNKQTIIFDSRKFEQ